MSILSEEDILRVAQAQLKTDEFKLLWWKLNSLDEERLGYMAEHYNLKITVSQGQDEIQLSNFVKTIPKQGQDTEFLKVCQNYHKESSLIPTLLKDLKSHSKEKVMPEYYLIRIDDVIVMEDLAESGYKMCAIRSQFDRTYCLSAMKSLANLHAASLIIEETKRQKLPNLYPALMMDAFFVDDVTRPGFQYVCSSILTIESLFESYFPHISKSICGKVLDLLSHLVQMMAPSPEYRNVACHGDLWSNNLMVSQHQGDLPHTYLVDYQLMRYAPPIADVLCLLHLNTPSSFRERHQAEVITYYYTILSEQLVQANIDPNSVLPRDHLEQSAATYKPLALATTLIYMPFLLLPTEVIKLHSSTSDGFKALLQDDRSLLALEAFRTDDIYRHRITEAIMEAVIYFQQR